MEIPMSIKTKIAALTVAAITIAAATAAEAKPKINPVAAGLIGAAVVGTAIAATTAPSYGYYPHHRHCSLRPQYNVFGQFVGYAKVCHWH
jgi:hypothetical protein